MVEEAAAPDPVACHLPAVHIEHLAAILAAAHNKDPAAILLPAAHIGARLVSVAAAHIGEQYDLLRQERARSQVEVRMAYELEHIHFLRP
ncbi:hypothetical protein KDH_04100 [Dictyobacter sp. S3.2.2.5]|uniref:Uncharacterized protein n=1 Tax=Dictyobacter halimunensis TaxID=3026934 RepID=A0ABQ6FHM1_9CHLR|nr:hypothetical protein KDH_04100 [Dictyobacter sp. S3.2.2.5]